MDTRATAAPIPNVRFRHSTIRRPGARRRPPREDPAQARHAPAGGFDNRTTGCSKRSRGVVRLTYRDQKSPKQHVRSHCGHRIPPFARRLGSEDPQRRSRDEMALKVEGVVDRGMHVEEPLGRSSRFEALHLALSSPHRLMRILGAVSCRRLADDRRAARVVDEPGGTLVGRGTERDRRRFTRPVTQHLRRTTPRQRAGGR